MARTPQYERLLAELDAGELSELERKVLDALLKAPGGITRRGLVRVDLRRGSPAQSEQ